ncbi:Methyl-CpG DNA binding,Helitron helicase-like domain,Leucine-rich repeat domain, L domain-like,DNA- [Cinara cedri]|uniref:Methyl-CpG DNA binding,Helitron helicase-like domain,Leucine-rich repeat domain, L domain-like,DNA n=1 Tax=Cinara cedri TaxID=506608 RepID=A0A5E4MSQ5_9HEMI|nr:Methyl-CpG DNA binding,Helitron helicase-like domain,Leucine-rich repeat domain, L domain-like,DNA- [Cinara cedri]
MVYVAKNGRPDLFITMTCNPNWSEIKSCLSQNSKPQDRNDNIARVFHLKVRLFFVQIKLCLIFEAHTMIVSTTQKSGRRTDIDITDPKFKLPFAHGWKRELVYRTSKLDDTTSNKTKRKSDVYYHSPQNKKLRSMREIQEELKLSGTLILTIENFTFSKLPLGINDCSKELIRDAKSKSSKDDSSFKSNKTKMPLHQFSNDFSTVSSPKRPKLDNMENSINIKQRTSQMKVPTITLKEALSEIFNVPISAVYDARHKLHQLEKLKNATSIENLHVPKDAKIVNKLVPHNIECISNMTNLTELRIKDLTGIKLLYSPELTFSCLTKLKTLSLTSITSIKSFPEDFCTRLETISTDLEVLEIGDCTCLPDDFPKFLKKLTNLRSLRLENCFDRWEKFTEEYFDAILSIKKLKNLELINIEFNDCVAQELAKCDGLTALLIIPVYVRDCSTINCRLIECLEKLSKTLTHVIWGLTYELLRGTDVFIFRYQQNQYNLNYSIDMPETKEPFNNIPILKSIKLKLQPQSEDLEILKIDKDKLNNSFITLHHQNQHNIGYSIDMPHTREPRNNIPILRSRKLQLRDEDFLEIVEDPSNYLDLISVPCLQSWLDSMMVNAKTKVIKIPFSSTTGVYLSEQFDDL